MKRSLQEFLIFNNLDYYLYFVCDLGPGYSELQHYEQDMDMLLEILHEADRNDLINYLITGIDTKKFKIK